MKTELFYSFHMFSIIKFFLTFKVACETNGILVSPAIKLSCLGLRFLAAAAWNSSLALSSVSYTRQKRRTLINSLKKSTDFTNLHYKKYFPFNGPLYPLLYTGSQYGANAVWVCPLKGNILLWSHSKSILLCFWGIVHWGATRTVLRQHVLLL